jgi:hypothetical protein
MKQRPDELSLRRRLLGGETVYGLVIKAPAPALVGASFVALASTLLIAQKFREVVAELYFKH